MDRDDYNKIFDNGLSHINSAKLLADNGEYGHAISHLILGIEELIKYHVMANYSVDVTIFNDQEVNPDNSRSIFNFHKTKHKLLAEFIDACSKESSEAFLEALFFDMINHPLKPEHLKIRENRFKEIGNIIYAAFSETHFTEEERADFFVWLQNANNNKNNGFYVDWKNGIWKTPKDFSKPDYETALKFTAIIQSKTQIIKDIDITDDEFIKMLNSDASANDENKNAC